MAIVTWIERTYHCRRRQRTLGRLTPIEFETIYPATLTPRSTRASTKAWALPIGRSLAYELVRAGRWPTPVVHAGRFIRIPTRPLLDLLGMGEEVA